MSGEKEYVKGVIDKLSDYQVNALLMFLQAMLYGEAGVPQEQEDVLTFSDE